MHFPAEVKLTNGTNLSAIRDGDVTVTEASLPLANQGGRVLGHLRATDQFFLLFAIFKTDISIVNILLICIGGALTWTLAEYVIHRFLYHTETNSEDFLEFQMSMHGNHHHYPKDPERLAMPPIPGLVLGALFFGFFYLIMGIYAVAFFPGFMLGYDAYITIHYYQHRIKSPNYKPWKKLWQHHKAHHYSNPYSAFGVSTRLWDVVFGTMPKASNKKRQVEVKAA